MISGWVDGLFDSLFGFSWKVQWDFGRIRYSY